MRRRKFLEALLATGSTAWVANATPFDPAKLLQAPTACSIRAIPEIKRVLIVFVTTSTQLRSTTQANVVHRYFNEFFPKAIDTAEQLDRSKGQGPDRANYTWTTGSWLLYEYLEQASAEQRKKMEQAIASNFIAWHAIPFSWQTELMDPSLISGAIALSQSLDNRFGRKTTGAKMTDVLWPHARHRQSSRGRRSQIPRQSASTTPALPPFSLHSSAGKTPPARNSSSPTTTTTARFKSSPAPTSPYAIVGDGRRQRRPPLPRRNRRHLSQSSEANSPTPKSAATDLTHIAERRSATRQRAPDHQTRNRRHLDPRHVGSDTSQSRCAMRRLCGLRKMWIANGKFQVGDATDVKLLRNLLLEAEHTWGTDTKEPGSISTTTSPQT